MESLGRVPSAVNHCLAYVYSLYKVASWGGAVGKPHHRLKQAEGKCFGCESGDVPFESQPTVRLLEVADGKRSRPCLATTTSKPSNHPHS